MWRVMNISVILHRLSQTTIIILDIMFSFTLTQSQIKNYEVYREIILYKT